MAKKIDRIGAFREVFYDEKRWILLGQKRSKAMELMILLGRAGIESITHGSIARGDVDRSSDVDVALLVPVPSFKIEAALESSGFEISHRFIVQATPHHVPKGYLALDPSENTVISFPLINPTRIELEFYSFGGAVTLEQLKSGERVPGVDKRLMLIEPTKFGHIESSILGREIEVSSILRISVETIFERVKVLTRRDKVGRTGTLLKHMLRPGESFEAALQELASRNLFVRRLLSERS